MDVNWFARWLGIGLLYPCYGVVRCVSDWVASIVNHYSWNRNFRHTDALAHLIKKRRDIRFTRVSFFDPKQGAGFRGIKARARGFMANIYQLILTFLRIFNNIY